MEKKQMFWKTKGMNRDLSVSAFNPEFAFENMNLRLTTNNGNTALSLVTEIGTDNCYYQNYVGNRDYSILGIPIGTAVINKYLVIFSTQPSLQQGEPSIDHIYRFEKNDDPTTNSGANGYQFTGGEIYQGNLGFDREHPLETLVSYESDDIQKVYWLDGIHQPRVINIVEPVDTSNIEYDEVGIKFDFFPELSLGEIITVKKSYDGGGKFAPGVIQYAFTYFNKNGTESNIFYTTPLYYLSFPDRGASPEESVTNTFKIGISNFDSNFQFIRVYSIQRTSIDGVPIVKRIQDIDTKNTTEVSRIISNVKTKDFQLEDAQGNQLLILDWPLTVTPSALTCPALYGIYPKSMPGLEWHGLSKADLPNLDRIVFDNGYLKRLTDSSILWFSDPTPEGDYFIACSSNTSASSLSFMKLYTNGIRCIDNGIGGEMVDPTELLYKGGDSFIANTFEQKDNTLFFGNIKSLEPNVNTIKIEIEPSEEISLKEAIKDCNITTDVRTASPYPISTNSDYDYFNQLNDKNCAGFKFGNYYRLGVQFQYKTGKWSEPLFIKDAQQNKRFNFGTVGVQTNVLSIPVFKTAIFSYISAKLIEEGYKRVRPVVVLPNPSDKVVLCQGVINPTVYTNDHRTWGFGNTKGSNDLYAQSSWFFRTEANQERYSDGLICPTNDINYTDRGVDVNSPVSGCTYYNPEYLKTVEIQGDYNNENKFQVDKKFITFHSPDVEFDTSLYYTLSDVTIAKQIGHVYINKTLSDITIQTESAPISNLGSGFIHKSFAANKSFGIVSGLFYDDFCIDDNSGNFEKYSHQGSSFKWMVYLWNKTGSLNNDVNRASDKGTISAKLRKKIISNLRYTTTTFEDPENETYPTWPSIGTPELFNGEDVSIVKVDNKIYQGNIDTVLTPDNADGQYFAFEDSGVNSAENPYTHETVYSFPGVREQNRETPFTSVSWWKTFSKNADTPSDNGLWKYTTTAPADDPTASDSYPCWLKREGNIGNEYLDLVLKRDLIRMKYKSTAHVVFEITGTGASDAYSWGHHTSAPFRIPIVELKRTVDPSTIFGGKFDDALKANVWLPCGEPVTLESNRAVTVEFSYGDTYFQRWDCLKTYAFTPEDENQVVEIGSFMLETYVNIDGRYDRNRGQKSNLYMSPQNFNLINPVYSQKDNFFNYHIVALDEESKTYINQIAWTKTKTPGADIDAWTDANLANTLTLDGDKGKVTKLIKFNNQLLALQDKGISQILYNENVQIASTTGVPIEIANSEKVQGNRYISDSVGCSNKWSIVNAPSGIYFIDNFNKGIYRYGDSLQNISSIKGFNSWAKQTINSGLLWNPNNFGSSSGSGEIVAYYDKQNQDVLFINKTIALAFSEKLDVFTSFYNYENTPYFCNVEDLGIWIRTNGKLFLHQKGKPARFFGNNKSYWTTIICNQEPLLDKTFTNLEFRASVAGEIDSNNTMLTPFDNIECWNEYQHGNRPLAVKDGSGATKHEYSSSNSLNRKFRIWRCDIPRDNATVTLDDQNMGIYRTVAHPLDRMRNPWLYIKMMKNAETNSAKSLPKTEIHDFVATYFV